MTLIKKHLINFCKFIAGKSRQCQTDFRNRFQANSPESRWTVTKYVQQFRQLTINSFEENEKKKSGTDWREVDEGSAC